MLYVLAKINFKIASIQTVYILLLKQCDEARIINAHMRK